MEKVTEHITLKTYITDILTSAEEVKIQLYGHYDYILFCLFLARIYFLTNFINSLIIIVIKKDSFGEVCVCVCAIESANLSPYLPDFCAIYRNISHFPYLC